MSGAKSPRGEHRGTPGTRWETELRSLGEAVCPDDDGDSPFGWAEFKPEDRPSRAVRRRAAREARRTTSGTSDGLRGPQAGSSGLNDRTVNG